MWLPCSHLWMTRVLLWVPGHCTPSNYLHRNWRWIPRLFIANLNSLRSHVLPFNSHRCSNNEWFDANGSFICRIAVRSLLSPHDSIWLFYSGYGPTPRRRTMGMMFNSIRLKLLENTPNTPEAIQFRSAVFNIVRLPLWSSQKGCSQVVSKCVTARHLLNDYKPFND